MALGPTPEAACSCLASALLLWCIVRSRCFVACDCRCCICAAVLVYRLLTLLSSLRSLSPAHTAGVPGSAIGCSCRCLACVRYRLLALLLCSSAFGRSWRSWRGSLVFRLLTLLSSLRLQELEEREREHEALKQAVEGKVGTGGCGRGCPHPVRIAAGQLRHKERRPGDPHFCAHCSRAA